MRSPSFDNRNAQPARGERRAVIVLTLAFWLILKLMLLVRIELLGEFPGGAASMMTPEFLTFHLLTIVPCFAINYGIYLVQRQARRVPMPAQIGLAVLCSIGGVVATATVSQAINMAMATAPAHVAWPYVIRQSAVYGWAPFACYTAAILVLLYSQELRMGDRRAARLEIEAREERLRAIRYQVDPHLLFNALNSISTMVLDRKNDFAEDMLLRLSNFYRRTLAIDPTADITLEREAELLMQYVGVEQLRFEKRLRVEIDIADDVRPAKVPSFILQPLVENSVKHSTLGLQDRDTVVRIRARAEGDRLEIVVADNGAEGGRQAPRPTPSTGIGLRNVRERLATRFGDRYRFTADREESGFVVRFAVPLELERQPEADVRRQTRATAPSHTSLTPTSTSNA